MPVLWQHRAAIARPYLHEGVTGPNNDVLDLLGVYLRLRGLLGTSLQAQSSKDGKALAYS